MSEFGDHTSDTRQAPARGLAQLAGALSIALFSIFGLSAAAPKAPKPVHIIIGLDLSRSNPLVTNEAYALKVAKRVAPQIADLVPRSQIWVRSFGAYDATAPSLRFDRTVSSVNRPEEIARIVEGVVAGVPTLVANGKLTAHMSTNIVPFLENMALVVDCRRLDTLVILVSDGIEDSEYAKLARPDATLPLPAQRMFRGCKSLEILGLGIGANSPTLTNHLREQWAAWADAAGFKDFHGLNDW